MSQVSKLIPDSVHGYFAANPRRLYLITVPLMAFTALQLVRAVRLHEQVRGVVAQQFSDAARAASEALGG